jgi:serine/threonine protein kinase
MYFKKIEFIHVSKLICGLYLQVNLLMRVHHKNLTALVGYCHDETNIGLVYEYMPNGNLRQHLSGLGK